jgi:hypothetical protein
MQTTVSTMGTADAEELSVWARAGPTAINVPMTKTKNLSRIVAC